MLKKSHFLTLLIIFISFTFLLNTQQFDDQLEIQQVEDSDQYQTYENSQNQQRQMQYMSQKRTACLVLSRYYTNQYSDDINGIVKDLNQVDRNKFINKLYATAVQKCQPMITQMEVMQFFQQGNQNFDPSSMFYIFHGYNFYQATNDLESMTQNQQNIVKFIKQFDSQMEVRKEEQEAKKVSQERDQGVQIFFISMKNLSPQLKYFYIVLVLLISAALLYWGFSQIGNKPEKKINKRRKKQ